MPDVRVTRELCQRATKQIGLYERLGLSGDDIAALVALASVVLDAHEAGDLDAEWFVPIRAALLDVEER